MKLTFTFTSVLLVLLFLGACTPKVSPLGSSANPIKIYLTPTADSRFLEERFKGLKDYLEKNTGLKFSITVPKTNSETIESFGTNNVDVATMTTFAYGKAHDKFSAQARLTVIRQGSTTFQSEFITRAGSKIKKLEDIAGKKIAFVDTSSMSGYLLPMKTLKDKKITPQEIIFAQKHEQVVSLVYQGLVDVGATFYSPPSKDEKNNVQLEDARRLVRTQYPDVDKKVLVVSLTEPIPNEPIVFRKEIPEALKIQITNAFITFIGTADGKKAFHDVYGVSDFKSATDTDYLAVRMMFKDYSHTLDLDKL